MTVRLPRYELTALVKSSLVYGENLLFADGPSGSLTIIYAYAPVAITLVPLVNTTVLQTDDSSYMLLSFLNEFVDVSPGSAWNFTAKRISCFDVIAHTCAFEKIMTLFLF